MLQDVPGGKEGREVALPELSIRGSSTRTPVLIFQQKEGSCVRKFFDCSPTGTFDIRLYTFKGSVRSSFAGTSVLIFQQPSKTCLGVNI